MWTFFTRTSVYTEPFTFRFFKIYEKIVFAGQSSFKLKVVKFLNLSLHGTVSFNANGLQICAGSFVNRNTIYQYQFRYDYFAEFYVNFGFLGTVFNNLIVGLSILHGIFSILTFWN